MISSFFFRSLDENRDILWCCSGSIWFLSKFELLLKYWIDKFWLLLPIFDFGLILNPTTTSYPMIFLGRRRLWNENPPKQKGSEQISKYTSMRTDLGNTYFFHETIFLKNQSDIERYWEFFFHANNRDEANSFGQGSFFAIWFHSKHIHDLGNIYVNSNISYARGLIPSNTPPPVQTNGSFSSNYNIDVKIWWKNIRKITSEKKNWKSDLDFLPCCRTCTN